MASCRLWQVVAYGKLSYCLSFLINKKINQAKDLIRYNLITFSKQGKIMKNVQIYGRRRQNYFEKL